MPWELPCEMFVSYFLDDHLVYTSLRIELHSHTMREFINELFIVFIHSFILLDILHVFGPILLLRYLYVARSQNQVPFMKTSASVPTQQDTHYHTIKYFKIENKKILMA